MTAVAAAAAAAAGAGAVAAPCSCMSWGPDPDGVNGVYLGKNVVSCAADALQRCLRQITPRVRGAAATVKPSDWACRIHMMRGCWW
jgi:hypothetical protein